MSNIHLLRMLRERRDYDKVITAVNVDTLDSITKELVHVFQTYYNRYKKHEQVDSTILRPMVTEWVNSKQADERPVYAKVVKNVMTGTLDETTKEATIQALHEGTFLHNVVSLAKDYNEGKEVDPIAITSTYLQTYMKAVGSATLPEVSENIDGILDELQSDEGYKWRLDCLNKVTRPLRGGDSGIIAARPDQGKTSFLASEFTFLAAQMPDNRCVLWLNNEGVGANIRPRLMAAALNCNMQELIAKKDAGTLYSEYQEAVRGEQRIRIMDIHGYNVTKVEGIIRECNPAIVIFDMLDNVKGFGGAARTDLALEQMYQWGREKAVQYDFVCIATSQISTEGANTQRPGLTMLKDSKTGKQGACDFQLMIGSLEDNADFRNTRWLSMPKNKIARVGAGSLNTQVTFDRERARFREVTDE